MPVRKIKASAKPSGATRAGKYVFRFSGFTMSNDTPYYLVGWASSCSTPPAI